MTDCWYLLFRIYPFHYSDSIQYAEMQARIGDAALVVNDPTTAIKCAQQALSILPEDIRIMHEHEWRWYALAEVCVCLSVCPESQYKLFPRVTLQCVYGRAMRALISAERQMSSYQDKLRSQSIAHFVTAVKVPLDDSTWRHRLTLLLVCCESTVRVACSYGC